MDTITYLMIVAYKLVTLTFATGVLIIALPIPLRGLKIWGGRLISDSILAFILISLYWSLISFSDRFPHMFGWSWESFTDWYTHSLALVMSLKALIAALMSAARAFYATQALATILWPADRVVNIVILSFITIGAVVTIVKHAYTYLAALGIALYAAPLRIGKSAGAWLLAFALVFNAGLPLLPAFIEKAMGAEPQEAGLLGVSIHRVRVLDARGDPVGAGLVHVHANGTEVAYYPLSSDGYLMGKYGSSYVSLPSKTPSYWILELDGVLIPLDPYPLYPNRLQDTAEITLRASYLLYQSGYTIIYTSSASTQSSVETQGEAVVLTISLSAGDYVEASAPSGCNIDFTHTGQGHIEEGTWTWRGASGTYKRFIADESGIYNITVSFKGSCSASPEIPGAKDYALDYLGLAGFARREGLSMLMGFVVLPGIYLFILSSITFAIARLLGGRERVVPRL